ncbi:serine/threonine-protein kinase PLK3-like [Paramormyrops kingsleyae]|uniref:serine/threonine-protein kinase PLK3-like n=1 Tax=Paramormyrops kingsleyae TaxID=1676925 RepID=UPI003B97203B
MTDLRKSTKRQTEHDRLGLLQEFVYWRSQPEVEEDPVALELANRARTSLATLAEAATPVLPAALPEAASLPIQPSSSVQPVQPGSPVLAEAPAAPPAATPPSLPEPPPTSVPMTPPPLPRQGQHPQRPCLSVSPSVLMNGGPGPDVEFPPGSVSPSKQSRRIATGGFAKCFKMMDIFSGEIFAVKVIPIKDSAGIKEVCEVEILKTLQHQQVVNFSHHIEDEKFMYIFMELCSRRSMLDILQERETLSNPEVRFYMRQLIGALQHMHGKGIVHRDLKLENLLLTENLQLKLADFGLATKLEPLKMRQKCFCGTREYAAPEVWKMEGHGPEADVWALGCIMYAMLVGAYPFDGTAKEIKQRVTDGEYILPKTLSSSARKLISWIFQRNPQDRPTLDQILSHKFFTKGFTPEELPSNSYYKMPRFRSAKRVKNFFVRLFQRILEKKDPKRSLTLSKANTRSAGLKREASARS